MHWVNLDELCCISWFASVVAHSAVDWLWRDETKWVVLIPIYIKSGHKLFVLFVAKLGVNDQILFALSAICINNILNENTDIFIKSQGPAALSFLIQQSYIKCKCRHGQNGRPFWCYLGSSCGGSSFSKGTLGAYKVLCFLVQITLLNYNAVTWAQNSSHCSNSLEILPVHSLLTSEQGPEILEILH